MLDIKEIEYYQNIADTLDDDTYEFLNLIGVFDEEKPALKPRSRPRKSSKRSRELKYNKKLEKLYRDKKY